MPQIDDDDDDDETEYISALHYDAEEEEALVRIWRKSAVSVLLFVLLFRNSIFCSVF